VQQVSLKFGEIQAKVTGTLHEDLCTSLTSSFITSISTVVIIVIFPNLLCFLVQYLWHMIMEN
jgi:hypothetical protein